MKKDFRIRHEAVRLDIPCPFDGGFTKIHGTRVECDYCDSVFEVTLKLSAETLTVTARLKPILLGNKQ